MAAFQRIQQLASQREVHAAFQWLHLHEPQLRRWQMELTAIPAPPFAESERAHWLLARFCELGLADTHIDAEGNVLGTLGHSTRPFTLISAHIDTVFPAGTDCTPREDDTRIHAPGICDNAAGLAALLGIAATLQHTGLRPASPVLFAANVGEEGEGDLRGIRHIFNSGNHRIAAALILDGSGMEVVHQALGSRRFRITITGPGGHSWADAGIPNPAFALSHALAAFAATELPADPRTTLNIGSIHSGTSVNSIPMSAEAVIDTRSTAPAELDRLEAILREAVAAGVQATNILASRAQRSERLTSTIALIGNRPSATLPADSPLLETIRAVDRHLNITTALRLGSTDANIPLALGIPAVSLGCGGSSAGVHTTAEWYSPVGREIALRRILLALLDLTRAQA